MVSLSSLKTGVRLGLVVGVLVLGYSAILGYTVYTYQRHLTEATARTAFLVKATDTAREAQVRFKIQVQEWKNTLLRGSDPASFEKYSKAFTHEEGKVQSHLKDLRELLAAHGADVQRVERLAASHRELGDKYRTALREYDSGALGSATRVDKLVRGMDRQPTTEMDELVGDVQKIGQAQQAAAALVNARVRSSMIVLIAVLSAAFVAGAIWLTRSLTRPLRQMVEMLRDIAEGEGDLTRRIELHRRDEIGETAHWFNVFVAKVHDIMVDVRSTTGGNASAAQQLSAASTQLSSGAQEQASSLEETAASLEEITATVRQNTENAKQANQLAAAARDTAVRGGEVVTETIQSMQAITQASRKIADIITVIDEIAFQTNLLALNAAVEAARAGEQGRGFAVVAAEVRNLAQRSATAAKEIKDLIKDSVKKVEDGSVLVGRSGDTLTEIVTAIKRVADIVADIAAASQEQAGGIEQVNKGVSQMDRITQENAAQTEELSSTAQALAAQAEQLMEIVSRFAVADQALQAGPAAPRAVTRAASGAPGVALGAGSAGSAPARAARRVRPTDLVDTAAAVNPPQRPEEVFTSGRSSGGNGHGRTHDGFEEF